MKRPLTVLCIGGSDTSCGAGIQADLKAVSACGCYGLTVITALTAQNTRGILDIFPVPPKFIAAQLDAVLSDIGADALKTGMMLTAGAVNAVVSKIEQYRLKNVVVDPVMIAKGGRTIMREAAQQALVKKLLPLTRVLTPNIPEAESLAQMKIRSVAAMKKAASVILDLGVGNVIIKGGHLPSSRKSGSVDILYDGKQYFEFGAGWINTKNTHGTGCTYASVLACGLAQGKNIVQAAEQAKIMVTHSIAQSLSLGRGHGPVNVTVNEKPQNECLHGLQMAINILAAKHVCQRIGFAVESFDRGDEPDENKNKEGFSLEWGVNKVLRHARMIPDIIYDRGGWGKEPMARVLGRNPVEVVNKVLTILKQL